jgi:small-conductance mechanosensitive channel
MIAALAQEIPQVELEQLSALTELVRWSGVLSSAVLAFGAWLLLRLLDGIVERVAENFAQWRMFLNKLRAVYHFTIYLLTTMAIVLLSLRLSGPVLTFLGGTAAVALGFAFKDLVSSLVAGVTIMVDRPFQVGDRVSFGGFYGDITSIGLRSVRMQTLDDNTITIPNNRFFTDLTSSGNYGELDMMVVIDFHIGVDQDVRRAREIVREIGIMSRYVFLEKDVTVTAAQVLVESYLAVRLRLKLYVLDTRYEKAMETDVTLRVLEAFAAEGIEPPAILHRRVAHAEWEGPGGSTLPQVALEEEEA